MNLDKYVKTDIDDGNGHIWLKFTNDSGNDTFACSQCGYMRRVKIVIIATKQKVCW